MIFNTVNDDVYIGENEFFNFKEASEIINKKELGRNKLLKLLREKKILDDYNHPIDNNTKHFFKVSMNKYKTPLISTYGINYIQIYLL